MTRRRPQIPQRRSVFVGCEGESEQSYAGLIQDLLNELDIRVQLNVEVLRAGDPLARVEFAVTRLARLRKSRTFSDKFVFLDTDQLILAPQRGVAARQLALQNGISIVWQEPCFEAVLVRHFEGQTALRPPTGKLSETALKRVWPNYKKPMSRAELAKILDLDAVRRAAAVEPDLSVFLQLVGLI